MGYTPPQLEVRKATGGWLMYPPNYTTTEDLTIYSNLTDATPYIKLNGTSSIFLVNPVGGVFYFMEVANSRLQVSYATPDVIIESPTADKNIYLKTTGTGTLKFGTFTGTGDLATNGYITVTDSGGTARRLAVVP